MTATVISRPWPTSAAVLLIAVWVASCVLAEASNGGSSDWNAPPRAARRKNPVPSNEKSIAAGKSLYLAQCQPCHGDSGRGDGPAAKALQKTPGNLSDPKMWDQTDGALFWKITEGRTPMPSFDNTLTDEQRWQVVNYVRTLAPRKQAASQPAR